MGATTLTPPRRLWRYIGILFAIVLLHYVLRARDDDSETTTTKNTGQPSDGGEASFHGGKAPGYKPSNPCVGLDGLDEIQVILKTGANEAPEKVPVHFETTLRCVQHYAIFSDYAEVVAGHQVYDALDGVNPNIVATHPDFEYYRRLRNEGGRDAFSRGEVLRWAGAGNSMGGRDSPGWRLDKWKFLPLADKALQLNPDAKWYVFMEADTYVLWGQLLRWLSYFNPHAPHYIGQQMQIGQDIFAYGGAGFVLSNSALRILVGRRNHKIDYYDDFTSKHWAGDCVLGKALKDAGVDLRWSWPNLISEHPVDMNFDDNFAGADIRLWCHHVASYHHMTPADMVKFAEFEHQWSVMNGRTLRHKDVFRQYVLPQLREVRPDWDNLADAEQPGVASFEACRSFCEGQSDCVQFSFAAHTCRTGKVVKLGRESKATPGRIRSGWIMDRVNVFMEAMDASCWDSDWILP